MKLEVTIESLRGVPGFWFLASPYTLYPEQLGGLEGAFQSICKIAGALALERIPFYCPIIESHPIAIAAGIDPKDAEFWLAFGRKKLNASYGIIAVRMPTWESSKGMRHEIAAFSDAGKPIVFLDP